MMRNVWLAVLVAATCTGRPALPERQDPPVPSAPGLATPHRDRPPAPDPATIDLRPGPEDRWLALAFTHAESVLIVEAEGVDADGALRARVVEEIRGFKTPAVTPLEGLAAAPPGSRWIVATHRSHGADPHGAVLAALPDSEANRARVRGWALPAWDRTPLVMVVKISGTPIPGVEVEGGRVVFDVIEVLRGAVAARRITDNAWPFEKLHPLVAGPQLYVMTAWEVEPPTSHVAAHPFVYVDALTSIERGALPEVRQWLAAHPRSATRQRVAETRRRLRELATAWTFHEAPLVAETVVDSAFEEMTNCGGRHFTLSPTRWLRGPIALAGPLFAGGGHCHRSNEQPGDRLVAAGWTAGGSPAVTIPTAAVDLRRIERWLAAPSPRFAARPVRDSVFLPTTSSLQTSSAAESAPFELDEAALAPAVGPGEWVRFEVVRRREVPAGNGHVHAFVHCRLRTSQERHGGTPAAARPAGWVAPEWMLSGQDMPALQVGRTYWAMAVAAHGPGTVTSPEDSLFVGDTFLPGGDEIDLERLVHLMQQQYADS